MQAGQDVATDDMKPDVETKKSGAHRKSKRSASVKKESDASEKPADTKKAATSSKPKVKKKAATPPSRINTLRFMPRTAKISAFFISLYMERSNVTIMG